MPVKPPRAQRPQNCTSTQVEPTSSACALACVLRLRFAQGESEGEITRFSILFCSFHYTNKQFFLFNWGVDQGGIKIHIPLCSTRDLCGDRISRSEGEITRFSILFCSFHYTNRHFFYWGVDKGGIKIHIPLCSTRDLCGDRIS